MDEKVREESFGERMRRLREAAGLTQSGVAALMNLTPQAISQYEQDKRRPGYECIDRFAEIYGVSVSYLIAGREEFPRWLAVADGLPEEARQELRSFLADLGERYGVSGRRGAPRK